MQGKANSYQYETETAVNCGPLIYYPADYTENHTVVERRGRKAAFIRHGCWLGLQCQAHARRTDP